MRWLALACLLLLPHQAAAAKDFIALTVSNEFRDGNIDAMCRLFESAAQNRVPLELICYGASWKGVGTKIQCLNDRLQQSDIDDNTLVLFVDAYDVVIARPVEDIIEKYRRSGARVLFGAECNCFPAGLFDNSTCLSHPPSTSRYRYLNSGTIMGSARDIQLLMKDIQESEFDQLALMRYVGLEGVVVDAQTILFQTFSPPHYPGKEASVNAAGNYDLRFVHHSPDSEEFASCNPLSEVYQGAFEHYQRTGYFRLVNARTGNEPAIFHFNGRSPSALAATQFVSEMLWYNLRREVVDPASMPPLSPLGLWDVLDTVIFKLNGKDVKMSDVCSFPRRWFPGELGSSVPPSPFDVPRVKDIAERHR